MQQNDTIIKPIIFRFSKVSKREVMGSTLSIAYIGDLADLSHHQTNAPEYIVALGVSPLKLHNM